MVWLPTGYNYISICRVEISSKDRLIGALWGQRKKSHEDAQKGNQFISARLLLTYNVDIANISVQYISWIALTLTSASLSSLCQSHTERMWSLESSTTHNQLPPFWMFERHFYHSQPRFTDVFKETVHPKRKIQSSFTHPQVIPNL